MNSENNKNKISKLQRLLEEQVKLAQGGNINEIDKLSTKTDNIVGEITLESLDYPDKERLQKLYDDLSLAIKAQMEDTSEQLRRLGKSAKTFRAYHKNI